MEGAPRGHIGARSADIPKGASDERIVFLRGGAVWSMHGDGKEVTQLTVRSRGAHESPALSPDARVLAYIAPNAGAYQLVVMNLDELVPTELTSIEFGQAGDPSFSPDGARIALMRGDPRDARDVVIVPVAGGEPQLLVEGSDDDPETGGNPAWSPDGRFIAFAADRREGRGTVLWLVDTDTGSLARLTTGRANGFHRDRHPSFTPDGKRIVFASNRHTANPDHADDEELYVIGIDGRNLIRLSEGKGASTDPCVSPDGRRIFFTSTRDAKSAYESDIYVMGVDGGAAARLSNEPRPQNSAPSVARVR